MSIYRGTIAVILAGLLFVALVLGHAEFERWLIRVNHPTSVRELVDRIRIGELSEALVVYSCYQEGAENIRIFDCFNHESAAHIELDFDPVCLRIEAGNHMVGVVRFHEEDPVLSYGMFYELSDDEVRRAWSCGRKPWWLRTR